MATLDHDRSKNIVHDLRDRLDAYEHRHARQAGWIRGVIPTGLTALDRLLPHGGIPNGAITDILTDGSGLGAMTLAMRIAHNSCLYDSSVSIDWKVDHTLSDHRLQTGATQSSGDTHTDAVSTGLRLETAVPLRTGPAPSLVRRGRGEVPVFDGAPPQSFLAKEGGYGFAVLIDTTSDLYPPAVQQHGIPWNRFIVVRPAKEQDAFWAADQALRCSSVSAVLVSLEDVDERSSRRLQLAAQSSGCIGVVLRSAKCSAKSFAAVQLLIEGVPQRWFLENDGMARRFPPHNHDMTSFPSSREDFSSDSRLCRITLLKVREGMPAGPVIVDLHHAKGARFIHTVPVDRSFAKRA